MTTRTIQTELTNPEALSSGREPIYAACGHVTGFTAEEPAFTVTIREDGVIVFQEELTMGQYLALNNRLFPRRYPKDF